MNSARSSSRLAAALLLFCSTTALADTRIGADVSLDGGYSSNPYGSATSNAGTAQARLSVQPFVRLVGPTGTTDLTGAVTRNEFARSGYRGATDYRVGLSTSQQVSTRMSLGASVGYSSQVVNAFGLIGSPIVIVDPANPQVPIIIDPSSAGLLQRRVKTLNGGVSMRYSISPRSALTMSASGAQVRHPDGGPFANDYDYIGGALGYQRTMSAVTTLGLQVNVARTNYRAIPFGDATMVTPAVTLRTRLNARLTVDADAGVTIVESDEIVGKTRTTAFSGRATLCNVGDRAKYCATVSRGVAPTSFGGNSVQTSLGLSYSYELTPRSSITVGAGYARSNRLITTAGGPAASTHFDTGTATAGYNRVISPRLSAFATVGYSDSFDSISARRANFYGNVGLRYRLGDRR